MTETERSPVGWLPKSPVRGNLHWDRGAALQRVGPVERETCILDIGAGSGASVPAARAGATITAIDVALGVGGSPPAR